MRTPRRLLLAILGAASSLVLFAFYHRLLGGLDGLPVLPERYLVAARATQRPVSPRREDRTSQWLRHAFGEHCPELRYNHHLRLQSQGLVLAFHDYRIVDGKFVLTPFSLAMIGRNDPRTGFPEISTIQCDEARLTFDRPVETFSDIARSKLRAAEFLASAKNPPLDARAGRIQVTHNHATPETADDLIAVTPGPVYFEDQPAAATERPHLWTEQGIEVTDWQSTPPAVVRAERFSLFLEAEALRDSRRNADGGRHPSGIRRVVLNNVFAQLPVDQSAAILGGTAPRPTKPSPPSPPIIIRTLGTFRFDVRDLLAEFESPPDSGLGRCPVSVARRMPTGLEELTCQTLRIAFSRASREATPSGPSTGTRPGFKIGEIHAVGAPVILQSAPEKLQAHGRTFIVRPELRQVTLRGQPATVMKEGQRLECPEITLCQPDDATSPGPTCLATAPGAGRLTLLDPTDQRQLDIAWKRELRVERDGGRDRFRLVGDVHVDDPVGRQKLLGEQMTLIFRPNKVADPSAAAESDSRVLVSANLETIEIVGRVWAQTDELVIDEAQQVRFTFHEQMGPGLQSADVNAPTAVAPATTENVGGRALSPAGLGKSPSRKRDRPPLHLRAETIQTHLRRADSRFELERVECRGEVGLSQLGTAEPRENLSVHANAMVLHHTPDGDLLQLFGRTDQPARVTVNELSLAGPRIDFDPRDNRVEIDGAGQAEIRVGTNLRGERLSEPTTVAIRWQGAMEFRANRISFEGDVLAQQESSQTRDRSTDREQNQVTCQRLDVYLDRTVSLNNWPPKSSELHGTNPDKPKIRKVVCHPGTQRGIVVPVELSGRLERDGKVQRMQRIRAAELIFDNDAGELIAQGDEGRGGEFRLFQIDDGTRTESVLRASSADDPTDETRGRVIHVWFRRSLRAHHKDQTISFTDSVSAHHVPTEDPEVRIQSDRFEPGVFCLRCRGLEVTLASGAGKRYVTMLAQGKAEIEAREFSGQADIIKYDESKKQLVIFDSEEGNPVTLHYMESRGREPMTVRGRTIYYWRETNEFRGIGLIAAEGSK